MVVEFGSIGKLPRVSECCFKSRSMDTNCSCNPRSRRTVAMNLPPRGLKVTNQLYRRTGLARQSGYHAPAANLVLQQTAMPLDQIHSKPLRLRLRREYDELIGQVNGFAPLRASDPFPLIGEKGVCAVRWPSDIGLTYLALMKKDVPPHASPLEIADARYDRGLRFGIADVFPRSSPRVEFSPRQSALQAGFVLAGPNRLDNAADVLESLRWQPGDRWPAMAGCQLWLLRLKQNRETDATEVFDSIQSRFSTEKLAVLISGQDRESLTSRYLSDFLYPSQLLRFDPNRLARVERAEEVLRLLSNNGALSTGNIGITAGLLLGRAYEFAGKPEQALEHYHRYLLSTSERAPRTRHYYRVLRLLGNRNKLWTNWTRIFLPIRRSLTRATTSFCCSKKFARELHYGIPRPPSKRKSRMPCTSRHLSVERRGAKHGSRRYC